MNPMNSLRYVLISCFLIIGLGAAFGIAGPAPTIISSSPQDNSSFPNTPQMIPFAVTADISSIIQAGQDNGGYAYGPTMWIESVSNPGQAVSFNEAVMINTWDGMGGGNQVTWQGSLVSKRLSPGEYKLVFQLWYSIGGEESIWTHEIPLTITGIQPALLEPAYTMSIILPATGTLPQRFEQGANHELSFHVQLTGTQENSIQMFGQVVEIRSLVNPDLVIPWDQAQVSYNPMGFGNTQGTLRIMPALPEGQYQLRIYYIWEETDAAHADTPDEPLYSFQFEDEINIPIEIFDEGAQQMIVLRDLPQSPVLTGIPFAVTLNVMPNEQTPTGVVVTEILPAELDYLPLPGPVAPEIVGNKLIWLLRDPQTVGFTQINYAARIKDTVQAATTVSFLGEAEILNQRIPITGDLNVFTPPEEERLECPIPNQQLLSQIDLWGKFVRDTLVPGEPVVNDLKLLQVIEQWRNCLRGGNQ